MRLGVGTNGQIRGRMDKVAGKGEKMVKKKRQNGMGKGNGRSSKDRWSVV